LRGSLNEAASLCGEERESSPLTNHVFGPLLRQPNAIASLRNNQNLLRLLR
jgi:hypothetical protein